MITKKKIISNRFPSEASEIAVGKMIKSRDWEKNYIENVGTNKMVVPIEFFDNPGMMCCINSIM